MKVNSIRAVAYLGICAVCSVHGLAHGQSATTDLNPEGTELKGLSGSGNYNWNPGNSNVPSAPNQPTLYQMDPNQNTESYADSKIGVKENEFNQKVRKCVAGQMAAYEKKTKISSDELAKQSVEIDAQIKAMKLKMRGDAQCTKDSECAKTPALEENKNKFCGTKAYKKAMDKKSTDRSGEDQDAIDRCKLAENALKENQAKIAALDISAAQEQDKAALASLEAQKKELEDTDKANKAKDQLYADAQKNCAEKFQNELAQSSDSCAESVNIRLIKDSGKTTEEELDAYLAGPGKAHKNLLEKKYGCKIDDRKLVKWGIASQLLQTGTEASAVIFGGKASENTANAFATGGDVYKTGNEEMGKAAVQTGTMQTGISLGQVFMAYKTSRIAAKHKKAAAELDTGGFEKNEICESGDTECQEGTAAGISSAAMAAKKYGGEKTSGRAQIENARQKHLEMAEKAGDQALQLGAKGVTNLAGGVNTIMYGKKLKDVAANMTPPPTVSPQLVPFAGVGSGDGAPPPTYQNPATSDNQGESPVVAQDLAKDDAAGGDMNLAPPLLGPPTEGGIKGDVPAPDNRLAGSGGGGSGGGGGGGGLSGGGSEGGEESPAEDGGGQNLSGGVSKFEGTGGGGPTFASTGGSDKRRVNDTGEMNLNSLLEKFMPKKDEDKPQGGLLDFGGGKNGERGLASQQDDGSILGPNSNLFARVSNTMVTNFKKGNLR